MADIKIAPNQWQVDGLKLGIKPGDKIVLTGPTRAEIEFSNLKDNVIIAEEAMTLKGNNPGGRGMQFVNCQGIRVTGSNAPIEITNVGHAVDFRDFCSDVEADNIEVFDVSYLGFAFKTDPKCDPRTWRANYKPKNVYFHHNKVRGTNLLGKGGEGMYIGGSHAVTPMPMTCDGKIIQVWEHEIEGVTIEDNTFEEIARDGIQVGGSRGTVIRRNKINNFAMTKEYGQGSGIQLNPGTVAEVYDNVITNGNNFGIINQGPGGSKIYRNLVVNTAGGLMEVQRIPAGGTKGTPTDFFMNTMVDINGTGIEYYDTVNTHENVIHVKSGQLFKLGGGTGKLVDINNVKLIGDRSSLKLGADYVPDEGSIIPANVGYFTRPLPIKEKAEIEVVTLNGVSEVYAVTPTRRIKINP